MTKFMLMIVSVLAANLLSHMLTAFMMARMRTEFSPAAATALGMLVLIAVLYPLFSYLDVWATGLSKFLLKTGKKVLGRTIGLFVVFLALLALLYYGYARLWFGWDAFTTFFGKWL